MSNGSVLVVGAGPTGLALAVGLLAAGTPVRVIDAAPAPATTSRALGLQPRGVEVLDRLGALGGLPEHGLPVRRVVVNVDGREIARLQVGATTPLVTRPGLLMSQAEIEGQLRGRLAGLGGRVEWGRGLLTADQDATGVTARFDNGDTVRAQWLVGCDGAHSRVRKAAGVGFPGVPLIERFLIADVHGDLPIDRDAVTTWLHGDEMLALFPLPGAGLWRVLAPQPADLPDDLDHDGRLAVLLRLLTQRTGIAADAVRGCEWTSSFRIHRRLADSYRSGRILLAGDAAHIHSPFGGQGMNTGLGDAENLAWKLALVATGRAGDALLDTYEAERRPIATEVLASTSSMTRVMLGGGVAARLVRDHVVVPLMNRPLVQRLITEASSQLKVSYRNGPLGAGRRWPAPGPRPGDRIPDLPCVRGDGTTTRLHAELGARWAVLTDDEHAVRVGRARLGDDAVVALRPVDPPRHSTMLVRPDAHLACYGTPERLDTWLAAALGPAVPAAVAPDPRAAPV
ncbi:MAG TPA: FAD-dependent monooxygenase [Catenuloplanes sp.]|jgi:4,5-epoxidase